MTDVQNDDSDSEWDSTLDFTSPRQTAGQQIPKIELSVEDDDFSRQESMKVEKPVPAERSSHPAILSTKAGKKEDNHSDNENMSVRSDLKVSAPKTTSIMKTPSQKSAGSRVEESPPYNFRPAVSGTITPQREEPRPGKDRKGTTYDYDEEEEKILRQADSFRSENSWDDSDADERTLQELRQTFSKEKQKEQEAEAAKQKQTEAPVDEGQMTNRSETTWKSWASFGSKKKGNRNRNNKREGVPVATKREVDLQQHSPVRKHDVSYMEGKQPYREEVFQGEKESVTNISEQPAMMTQPYIVKDDQGVTTYYFGHGPLQYLEVEDEAQAFMPRIADRLEVIFERIWQEAFGALRIVTSFVIILVVELLKYIIKAILMPIFVGVFETLGDFIMKPLLSILFNGFMQPLSIFLWNSFMTLKHMFSPIGEILRKILREIALCCRSVRLVEINWKVGDPGPRVGPVDYSGSGLQNV